MASDARRRRVHVDGDGVRIEREPLAGRVLGAPGAMLALAAGAAVAALVLMRFAAGGRPVEGPPAPASDLPMAAGADAVVPAPAAAGAPPAPAPPAQAERGGHVQRRQRPAREESAPVDVALELHARDVIPALVASGEKTGIAVFPLPGTDPLKSGVIVPEGFELPEGFVRHYQTDDEGRQLPPVLTVHPDYDLVNERGEVVALPDGRIVPPELAPAGMPIRMLEVPKPGDVAHRSPALPQPPLTP